MNLIQEIIKAQGGDVVSQLGKQFGLDNQAAQSALTNLIPMIAGGVKKAASSPSTLDALVKQMSGNADLQKAIDFPDVLGKASSTDAGNEILGSIFGSKDVSRTVADQTAKSTGLDLGMLKKMLPVIAGLVMSSLNQKGQSSSGGLGELLSGLNQPAPTRSGGLGGLLGTLLGSGRQQQKQTSGLESMLDFDGDGDIADDVLKLAKKLF